MRLNQRALGSIWERFPFSQEGQKRGEERKEGREGGRKKGKNKGKER